MKIEWIKMGLLMMSCFGYWEYFRAKHKINIYFAPVFTISLQFAVLLAAGILNCLQEAAVLLYGLGFFLLLREVYRNKLRIFTPYINAGYLFCVLAFFVIGYMVHDKRFSQIDNFTHWATVVRSMLMTDRFPTFKEAVIEFTSYPLGSSALIYYICKMTGDAEHMQMWAQTYFMLCTILPVFACCPKNKGAFLVPIITMTGFLLSYNIPVTELLVDTLMPLAGMAAALFICYHCVPWEDKEPLCPYYAIPLLIWTMNIKIAALLFVAFDLVLLYLCIRKKEQGKKQWAIVTAAVLFANVLWNRHCDYVFAEASASRHSLSLDWFGTILGDKTVEDVTATLRMVCLQVATRTEGLWLAAWFAVLGILVWFLAREQKRQYGVFLISGISLYAVYAIGIAGMYIFSMEGHDELLAFTRYMRSVDIAVYYMLLVFSGQLLSKLAKRGFAAAVSVLLVLMAAASWHWQTGKYLKEQLARCSQEWRQELEAPLQMVQPGKRYLLCVPEDYHGWPRRIWRYNLQTDAVDYIAVTDSEQLNVAEKYDYVVILERNNPIIEAWIQECYPDAVGSDVIQCAS